MSLIVNHNLMSMNAARNLTSVFSKLGDSVSKLSSGLRVVSAADDAAGMAIRELMRSDIAVLNQGIRNASDAISMIQTAEGAMSVIDEKLIRMKELAEQAATGTYTTAQREIMNSEYQAMAAEIDRIATATDFNGVKLLDGSLEALHSGSGLKVHFGAGNSASEDYYYVSIGDMRATQGTGLRVGTNDTRDTWTTTGLNLTSADNSFSASNTGVFGLQYTHDGGTTWNTYGFVSVDQNEDTLTSIVEEINQGAQSTVTLNFGSGTTASFDDQTVTINGQVLTFDTGTATSTATTVGISTFATAASIAFAFAESVNEGAFADGDSNVDALAVVSGATVTLYHEQFGTPTGTTTLGSSFAGTGTLNMGSTWTATTGTHLGASAVWQDQFGYELQVKANDAGDNHQIRITRPDGGYIDNSSSGVSLTASGGPVLNAASGSASTFLMNEVDEASEWQQTVNGSGSTTWSAKDILTQSAAQQALAGLDSAINSKDEARANLGATQNRLENTITNLQIQAENLQAAESRISDVDVASEMTRFTSNNILAQSAVAMLAQANSLPSLALSLLGG
jgi:flagellin